MPHVRLLAPDPDGEVSGAAGDVTQVDGSTAHRLVEAGVAVIERDEGYRTAITGPTETTEG